MNLLGSPYGEETIDKSCHFLTELFTGKIYWNPEERQKAEGFLTFSGGIEMEYWAKIG